MVIIISQLLSVMGRLSGFQPEKPGSSPGGSTTFDSTFSSWRRWCTGSTSACGAGRVGSIPIRLPIHQSFKASVEVISAKNGRHGGVGVLAAHQFVRLEASVRFRYASPAFICSSTAELLALNQAIQVRILVDDPFPRDFTSILLSANGRLRDFDPRDPGSNPGGRNASHAAPPIRMPVSLNGRAPGRSPGDRGSIPRTGTIFHGGFTPGPPGLCRGLFFAGIRQRKIRRMSLRSIIPPTTPSAPDGAVAPRPTASPHESGAVAPRPPVSPHESGAVAPRPWPRPTKLGSSPPLPAACTRAAGQSINLRY